MGIEAHNSVSPEVIKCIIIFFAFSSSITHTLGLEISWHLQVQLQKWIKWENFMCIPYKPFKYQSILASQ